MKYTIRIIIILCCFQTALRARVPGFVGKKNVLEININPLHGGRGDSGSFADYNSSPKYFVPSITFERVVGRRSSFSLSWSQNKFKFTENIDYQATESYSNSVALMNRLALQYHYNLKHWGLSPLGFYAGVGVSRNFISASTVYQKKKTVTNINENFKLWGLEISIGNRFITKNNISINWGIRSLFIPQNFIDKQELLATNKHAYRMGTELASDFIISFYIGAGYVF